MYDDEVQVPMGTMSEHNTEGSIKFQLTFEDIIDDIEHTLRCEQPVLMSNGSVQWQLIPGGEPLINERGMARLRTILRSKLNRNAPLSSLDDHEIRDICRDVEMNVRDTMIDNWEEFGITDISSATTIRETVGDAVFINLKKAGNGRFLRHLRSTHHVNELYQGMKNAPRQPRQSGIMDKLLGKR